MSDNKPVTMKHRRADRTRRGLLGVAIASAAMAWAYLTGEEDPTPAVAPRMQSVTV